MVLIPGQEPSSDPYLYPVYTRSGWQIPCRQYRPQPEWLIQNRAQDLQKRIRGTVIRSVDAHPYNCAGMIFASRRAWIEIDYIYDLLHHDGYTKIERSQVQSGDLVVYKRDNQPTHVGVIMTVDRVGTLDNMRILSKWGKDAEFMHGIDQVPVVFGRPDEFYTDRHQHEHIDI